MRSHISSFTEANIRRSKLMMACWIATAIFFGSCDRSPEAKLAQHVKRGDAYAKEEKFKEAAAELKAALSLDPKFPGADEAKKTLEGLK